MSGSAGRRRRSPPSGDQLLLGVVGVGLILAGIVLIFGQFTDTGEFAGYPLILVGVVVLILRSFHPWLQEIKLFNRIELTLMPNRDEESPERERQARPEHQGQPHPPSLREISKAAQNPDTERRRGKRSS